MGLLSDLRPAAPDRREIARKGPLMAKGPPSRLFLIVTGSTLGPRSSIARWATTSSNGSKQVLGTSQDRAGARRPVRLPGPGRRRLPLDPRRSLGTCPRSRWGGPASMPWPTAGSRRSRSRWPSTSGISSRWTPTLPTPRQHLGHGQPHHPDRRLGVPRPFLPRFLECCAPLPLTPFEVDDDEEGESEMIRTTRMIDRSVDLPVMPPPTSRPGNCTSVVRTAHRGRPFMTFHATVARCRMFRVRVRQGPTGHQG